MISYDFQLQLRVRNVGHDPCRAGIRASIQRKLERSDNYVEVSQTETVYHENNVNFKHRCLLPFSFGQESTYKIVVYGVRDESGVFTGAIGKVNFTLASIISSKGSQIFTLFPNCFLDAVVTLSESYSQGIRLQFAGHNLSAPDDRPLAAYIAVLLCTTDRNLLLYKSSVIKTEKNPVWSEFVLALHLVQHYLNSQIRVCCFNYNANTADSLIGSFSTTFSQLQQGAGPLNSYMLTDSAGSRLSEKTCIGLTKIEDTQIVSFLDLFKQNTSLALSVAVDLTASNGKPDDESSLHYIHPYSTSPYEHSMLQLLPEIVPFMSQPKIVALGFGAKIEPAYQLSHCFNLSGSRENSFVNGISGLIDAYRTARMVVKPFAPTDFSEVIYNISKFAKAEARNPHGLYFTLFIFTDGAPAQLTRTINAIVDASPYPLSIVAVALGENKDFGGLNELQSPFLKHTDGRQLSRQKMDLNAVDNVLYIADSYKITHHAQYPEGTTEVYSYFESRGGKFSDTTFFGLQYIMKRWLLHFGGQTEVFNEEGWNYIVDKYNGCLPLRIKAVPEGTVVPTGNVLFTVENTDPKVPWLTNWFETLLVQSWYPTTVCTNSREQKKIIAKYLLETSEDLNGLPFKLHDFGYRGSTSVESAGIGGAAHLVNFLGTDTIAALQVCRKYYGCPMAGFSIPAAEHSTITTWRKCGEVAAYKNMMDKFPTGLLSVVSDSYDVYNAVSSIWGGELREDVVSRGENGCLVIRPDSGDPATVITRVLSLLEEKFPVTVNAKGYKVLPSYLRIMQGDGISFETLADILESIKAAGWCTSNCFFGSGGALLQKLDRDTQKFAFKCSKIVVNGEHRNIFKNPTTDAGKRSKKGTLTLEEKDGALQTVQEGLGDPEKDILRTVFENGRLLVDWTLEEIRERAEIDDVVASRKQNGRNNNHGDG